MERTKPNQLARRILPIKNQDAKIPIEELLEPISKTTNKEWAEHWLNIVLLSEMWKAVLRMVKK